MNQLPRSQTTRSQSHFFARFAGFSIFALTLIGFAGVAGAETDDPVADAESRVGQSTQQSGGTSYFQKALADAGVANNVNLCISNTFAMKLDPGPKMDKVRRCILDAKLALGEARSNMEQSKLLDSGVKPEEYADLAQSIGNGQFAIEKAEENYNSAVEKSTAPAPDAGCTLSCTAPQICKFVEQDIEKDGKKEKAKVQQCVAPAAAASSGSSASGSTLFVGWETNVLYNVMGYRIATPTLEDPTKGDNYRQNGIKVLTGAHISLKNWFAVHALVGYGNNTMPKPLDPATMTIKSDTQHSFEGLALLDFGLVPVPVIKNHLRVLLGVDAGIGFSGLARIVEKDTGMKDRLGRPIVAKVAEAETYWRLGGALGAALNSADANSIVRGGVKAFATAGYANGVGFYGGFNIGGDLAVGKSF